MLVSIIIIVRHFEKIRSNSDIRHCHMICYKVLRSILCQPVFELLQESWKVLDDKLSEVLIFIFVAWEEWDEEVHVGTNELFSRLQNIIYFKREIWVLSSWIECLTIPTSVGAPYISQDRVALVHLRPVIKMQDGNLTIKVFAGCLVALEFSHVKMAVFEFHIAVGESKPYHECTTMCSKVFKLHVFINFLEIYFIFFINIFYVYFY